MTTKWSNGYVDWIEDNTVFISAVFSWQLDKAYQKAIHYQNKGHHVKIGGPSITNNLDKFKMFDLTGSPDALAIHNPDATFTSRGCIRNCSFCAVPKIEGKLVELNNWKVKPIVCDNNLLACSDAHFDEVINKLLENNIIGIDFNQGLDARLLTDYHASRFAELPKDTIIRLAWDNIKTEMKFRNAFNKCISKGIEPKQIRVYVLIGCKDTPEDAQYRLETILKIGALPNPMRYQPLDAEKKNNYVDENWTDRELKDYMRYYARSMFFGRMKISFDGYKEYYGREG